MGDNLKVECDFGRGLLLTELKAEYSSDKNNLVNVQQDLTDEEKRRQFEDWQRQQ